MKFCTWSVRSLYGAGSVTATGRELARYKLDLVGVQEVRLDREGTVRARGYNLVGVQEVRLDREGTVRAGGYNFFYGKDSLYEK